MLLVAYVGLVAWITLSPHRPGMTSIDRIVDRILAEFHERGMLLWADFFTVEFTANVVMFVPLGILLAVLIPARRWWMLVLAGPLLSGAIELAQLVLLPARFSDVRDLLANSLGFLIGAALALLWQALSARSR